MTETREPKASISGSIMTDAEMIAWLMSTFQHLQAGTHPGVTGTNYALMGLCEEAAARISRLAQENQSLRAARP